MTKVPMLTELLTMVLSCLASKIRVLRMLVLMMKAPTTMEQTTMVLSYSAPTTMVEMMLVLMK